MRTYRTDNARAGVYSPDGIRTAIYGDEMSIFWRGYKTETMNGGNCTLAGFHAIPATMGGGVPFKLTAQGHADDTMIRVNHGGRGYPNDDYSILAPDRWNTPLQFVATVKSGGQAKLYDGAHLVGGAACRGPLPFTEDDTKFIASSAVRNPHCWGGGVSLVMVWARELTAGEVEDLKHDPYAMFLPSATQDVMAGS
jgi:hypothetical protein